MNDVFLQLAIRQAVEDGLGTFLALTGVVRFGPGLPQIMPRSASPVPLSEEQPAAHAGPNNSEFYVLMDDTTRALWRSACK